MSFMAFGVLLHVSLLAPLVAGPALLSATVSRDCVDVSVGCVCV